MDFLKQAWDSKLFSHELAFKLSLILGALFFTLTLLRTNIRHKRRPILILYLYGGYVALQMFIPTEFFPLSAFQARSYSEPRAARYVKILKVMEGGDIVPLEPHPLLQSLAGGRRNRSWEKMFNNPQACNRFAKAYSAYEFRRDPKVGRPMVKELHFESWKWDWFHEPQDPDYGFFVKRMVCTA